MATKESIMNLLTKVVLFLSSMVLLNCAHHEHKGNHDHHAKMWEKMDKNADGVLTKEEFDAKHAEKFKEMDKNSDGKVTPEEMKEHHASMKMDKKACCQ
jgi:Ca2+-binding EF-hand superfamily protein